MKKLILFIFFLISTLSIVRAQNAYIQVKGESGLSVYLNNQLKGKTSADIGGYIIENVTPGKNTIKIVKEGFAPFEEVITVKPGEVLAYQVKPFSKHTILISEQGNTQSTNEQIEIETGVLRRNTCCCTCALSQHLFHRSAEGIDLLAEFKLID